MKTGGDLALLIGRPAGQGTSWTRPAELLREVVGEILTFPTLGDALDGFCLRRDTFQSGRKVLLVIDQRGTAEIRWTWLALLAHLDFGPLILLVDDVDAEIEGRARRVGVLCCLGERHLAHHAGLLVRAARRALGHGLRFAGAPG